MNMRNEGRGERLLVGESGIASEHGIYGAQRSNCRVCSPARSSQSLESFESWRAPDEWASG